MTAQVAETILHFAYCIPCKDASQPVTTTEAEAWAARHDADHHPEPEGEDG
jgi:hypothetical protein